MGGRTCPVWIGIVVGAASVLAAGSLLSIAATGTEGGGAVDAARSGIDVISSPADAVTPSATRLTDTPSVAPAVEVAVVETVTRPVVHASFIDGPAAVPVPPVRFDRVVLVGDSLADEAAAIIRYLTPHT